MINAALPYIDQDYMVSIRRQLHMYPEIGFDLPTTLNLVRTELDKMGVTYTERFGKSCIVAYLNDHIKSLTIGLRADMDALAIQEKNDVEYKSRIDGAMHACGHDVHTATLLGTLKALNQVKDEIKCRLVFLFQAAEEGLDGAQSMVDDGVTDEFDFIIGCHVDNTIEAGSAMFRKGPTFASSDSFKIELFGKSGHGAAPHAAIDAINMGIKVYNELQSMVAKEIDPLISRVLSVTIFNARNANNILPDHCVLGGTIRTHSNETADYIKKRMNEIVSNVAQQAGGRSMVNFGRSLPAVISDGEIAEKLCNSALNAGINARFRETPLMYSEDFANYLKEKPGAFFFLGSRNTEKGIISMTHNNDFDVDESCLEVGAKIYTQFIFENMGGLKYIGL